MTSADPGTPDWPNLRVNGERMVPLCCQECGVQMGLRSPGPPPDPSYCFDCAPILSPALTAQLFDCLADAWVRDTQFTSSLEEIMSHPAVGLLVSLGRPIPGSYYSPGYYPTHQVVQEGWRCPVCKTVHAPFMPTCTRCSPAVVTRVANVTTADTPTPEDTDE